MDLSQTVATKSEAHNVSSMTMPHKDVLWQGWGGRTQVVCREPRPPDFTNAPIGIFPVSHILSPPPKGKLPRRIEVVVITAKGLPSLEWDIHKPHMGVMVRSTNFWQYNASVPCHKSL